MNDPTPQILDPGPPKRRRPLPVDLRAIVDTFRRHPRLSGGLALLLLLVLLWPRGKTEDPVEPPVPEPEPEPSQLAALRFPTDQRELLGPPLPHVFQPTSSGRATSGTYGSVRTDSRNRPRFHEGIDIAPLKTDQRGRALDPIYAVADGHIAYINRIVGASNYGKYVVLEHEDPVGTVYTLYGHLASVPKTLHGGAAITRGTVIGTMGSTSNYRERFKPHLHFEIGLINHGDFARQVKSVHGRYNGMNLLGLSPLRFFAAQREAERYSMLAHLHSEPVAFEIVVRTSSLPDFFRRYGPLWQGPAFSGTACTLRVADVGAPLAGRTASAAELRELGARPYAILNADPDVLGRNGRALVAPDGDDWTLGRLGSTWLQRLLAPSAEDGATRPES